MTLDYKPSEEFQVSKLQSLLDFDVTGAKELWLIQCPISHFPEIEAKELKVKMESWEDSRILTVKRLTLLALLLKMLMQL
ncbi:unnamed protein product [Brassica oleracea var. botrytis]|uniref:Uncharacterized protein n=1 Tax=Brassica oleracea TaxID=3712 RepID=A0A3P6BBE6_BRAOL|nr:unnamed protein product [Brassica oleracea]